MAQKSHIIENYESIQVVKYQRLHTISNRKISKHYTRHLDLIDYFKNISVRDALKTFSRPGSNQAGGTPSLIDAKGEEAEDRWKVHTG